MQIICIIHLLSDNQGMIGHELISLHKKSFANIKHIIKKEKI